MLNSSLSPSFQEGLITEHVDDFIFVDNFITTNLTYTYFPGLPAITRIITYSGLPQIITAALHRFSDIMNEMMETKESYLDGINTISINQQLITWFRNIIELSQTFKLHSHFEKVIVALRANEFLDYKINYPENYTLTKDKVFLKMMHKAFDSNQKNLNLT